MDGQVDSHQWVSKTEMQHLFSGKPDLEIEAHTQTADDEPTPRQTPLPRRISSLFKRAVMDRPRT